MALYIYREGKRSDLLSIKTRLAPEGLKLTNPIMLACNLLLATVLGLATVSVARLILPLNIIGNSIELLISLACLATVVYIASHVD